MKRRPQLLAALVLPLAGCGSSTKSDAAFQAEIVAGMTELLQMKVQALSKAAHDLHDAAPTPMGRGWDASDQPAIETMKNAWNDMRAAWEGAEGILASLFPDLDVSLDTRYEDFLTMLGPAGDADLFDDKGVTGMHAIERILWAPEIRPAVIAQESPLPGYVAAAWPATVEQAAKVRDGLCTKMIGDVQIMVGGLAPGVIDLSVAFEGLTELMGEQKEKVSLAGDHVDESRYARRTLGDLRDNLAGTRAAYSLFVPWLMTKHGGAALDGDVQRAFDRLDETYTTVFGDAIPDPPVGWNSELPTPADQGTQFGKLYVAVVQEVDVNYPGSAVDAMNHVAQVLGLPEFVPEP